MNSSGGFLNTVYRFIKGALYGNFPHHSLKLIRKERSGSSCHHLTIPVLPKSA
ncbi:MAG: hypothetical protein AB2L14_10530 [Candidatus Xenobiia bacterium LiM19]